MTNKPNSNKKSNSCKEILNNYKSKRHKQMRRLMRSMPNKKSLHKDWLKYQEDKNYYNRDKSYYKRETVSWRKESRKQSLRLNYKLEDMNNNSNNRVSNNNKKMTKRSKV